MESVTKVFDSQLLRLMEIALAVCSISTRSYANSLIFLLNMTNSLWTHTTCTLSVSTLAISQICLLKICCWLHRNSHTQTTSSLRIALECPFKIDVGFFLPHLTLLQPLAPIWLHQITSSMGTHVFNVHSHTPASAFIHWAPPWAHPTWELIAAE